jgi:hypothetical protein
MFIPESRVQAINLAVIVHWFSGFKAPCTGVLLSFELCDFWMQWKMSSFNNSNGKYKFEWTEQNKKILL